MTKLVLASAVVAVFAGAMWFAWLGWDHGYYDVDGVPQGPYRTWQVVGCGLSIAICTVLAYLRVRGITAMVALAFAADMGFAIPWGRDASSDETGLWLAGLFFLVIGSGIGLIVLLVIVEAMTGSHWSPGNALGATSAITVLTFLAYPSIAVIPLAATAYVFVHQWLPARR